ncbi:MAG: L-seryl-tRNA(Sec) selenium transferase [Candidatus Limnocylindrales bacterium]
MSDVSPSRHRPPSVERVLGPVRASLPGADPSALAALVRAVVDAERERLARGGEARTAGALAAEAVGRVLAFTDPVAEGGPVPPRVVNATGVVLHTNLGRAPWPAAAIEAAIVAAAGYGYLELDEVTGRRGARFRAAEEHLVALTGAEAALVVTNAAAALLLAVGLAGRRGSVVVSRGELVEIGGGVRIPEVVARAGARLVEVGTTNRTRAADFEEPLVGGRARLVLRVHPSNFTVAGFAEAADLAEVAAIAHRHEALVVDDLGSGALLDTGAFGLAHEPMPSERLASGADVVVFSGDKLVGGPQAGLIVGRAALIARLRRDPLARAMRPDKAILAGVAATLGLYRAGRAVTDVPVWRAIARTPDGLRERAASIASAVGSSLEVVVLESTVGGGSLPGQVLPSAGVALRAASPDRLAAVLRRGPDRVLARIEGDALVCDLRTVEPEDDVLLAGRLADVAR